MIRPDPPGRGSAPRPAWAGMALHPPEAGLDLGLESGAWPGLHCWLGAAAWAGGLMCGGTPGGTIAVGSLGPGVWPWPASGAAAGGIACQPPGRELLAVTGAGGDTWGGRPMVIMSTASLSTPFMSTLPGGPEGGLGCLLASPVTNLAGPGGWTLYWWPGLGSMLGGGVLYCMWGWGGPALATPPS